MKKALSFILCAALSAPYIGAYAEQTAELETASVYLPVETSSGGITSYKYYDENGNRISFSGSGSGSLSETLPDYYKSEYLTPVKRQLVNGPCWAFAAISSIEANLMKKGYADTDIDLSEAHLAYFAYNPFDGIYTDGVSSGADNAGNSAYIRGGNQSVALAALLRRNGAAYESEAPYSYYVGGSLSEIDEELRYIHHAGVKNQYYAETTEDIKSLVYRFGAAAASYHDESDTGSQYYNSSTYAYHYNGTAAVNHGITIVGWDDSFPRESFTTQPKTDGAWIAKNSWGAGWGDGGYQYISYETPISAHGYDAYIDDYDNTYSHTGYLVMAYSTGCKLYANSFTARDDELLRAVSVATHESGEADIYIFKNNSTVPDSGQLLKKLSKVMIDGVYNTIELPEPVALSKGDRFSVIVSGISVDFEATYGACRSQSGQSYAMPYSLSNFTYNGSNAKLKGKSLWTDGNTGASEYDPSGNSNLAWGNNAIRAFTDNLSTPEPTETPTPEPTEAPTPEPTETPTPEPTEAPTPEPTEAPAFPFTITAAKEENGLTFTFRNNYFNGNSANILITEYSESGELIYLNQLRLNDIPDEITLKTKRALDNGNYMTAHLWNDLNNMIPLSEAVTVKYCSPN